MQREIAATILAELSSRLRYLVRVDLAYLTLDRLARSSRAARRRGSSSPTRSARTWSTHFMSWTSQRLDSIPEIATARGVLSDLARRGNTLVIVEHDPC